MRNLILAFLIATVSYAAMRMHLTGDKYLLGLFFEGLGSASVPLVASGVLSGFYKLFARDGSFTSAWTITFTILALFAGLILYQTASYRQGILQTGSSSPHKILRSTTP